MDKASSRRQVEAVECLWLLTGIKALMSCNSLWSLPLLYGDSPGISVTDSFRLGVPMPSSCPGVQECSACAAQTILACPGLEIFWVWRRQVIEERVSLRDVQIQQRSRHMGTLKHKNTPKRH